MKFTKKIDFGIAMCWWNVHSVNGIAQLPVEVLHVNLHVGVLRARLVSDLGWCPLSGQPLILLKVSRNVRVTLCPPFSHLGHGLLDLNILSLLPIHSCDNHE